jgi:hypothetical protein
MPRIKDEDAYFDEEENFKRPLKKFPKQGIDDGRKRGKIQRRDHRKEIELWDEDEEDTGKGKGAKNGKR